VNSDEALALCRSHYPPYTLPTIATILQSWHDHSVAAGIDMRAGLLWKEDVRNAFGQITLDTDSAMRSCLLIPVPEPARANARAAGTPLPAYLVVILLWCYFGWCGASLAYDLLGGLIDLHIRGVDGPAIRGVISTYVDDVAGFGHPSTVHADQAHARATITAILGPDGLADKSLLPCPAGEILGWHVDLPRLTLLPSTKGCRKLLWTFFTLDVTAKKWPAPRVPGPALPRRHPRHGPLRVPL
jgi:hypothetical protein